LRACEAIPEQAIARPAASCNKPDPNQPEAVMSFVREFREFAVKGSVVDLAVGVIIGAAFGRIVDSLVKDIIMPVIGAMVGGLDFSNYFIALKNPPAGYSGPMTYEALTKAGVPVFAYGNFFTVALNFLILALIIFLMVKQINRLKRAEPPAPPKAPPEEVVLLREIRDSLRR
jgi:large conductance mechanosensitive channel